MARYHEIADDLRRRITVAHEWEVGDKIPGISDLMGQYETPSLGVIRRAQQILVNEGLLRTEQGSGAFVVSLEARAEPIDVLATLGGIRDQLDSVISALRESPGAETSAGGDGRQSAELWPVLQQVLRLQQDQTRLDAEWRTAMRNGNTEIANELEQKLGAIAVRIEELADQIVH